MQIKEIHTHTTDLNQKNNNNVTKTQQTMIILESDTEWSILGQALNLSKQKLDLPAKQSQILIAMQETIAVHNTSR